MIVGWETQENFFHEPVISDLASLFIFECLLPQAANFVGGSSEALK
jgi:hypothetical protein